VTSQADVIGVTVNSFFWWSARNLIARIRKILPSVIIVGGGPHMWPAPEETLKKTVRFDVIVQGEGEKTFIELMEKTSRRRILKILPAFYTKKME